MNYQYAGGLYPTREAMLDDMVEAYVIYDGRANAGEVENDFDAMSSYELAEDMIDSYGLSDDDEHGGHMGKHGYTVDDLAQAFGRLRQTWRKHFEAE